MKTYKYKLNMLEPGWKMLQTIGMFCILGIIFYVMKINALCYLFWGLAAFIGIVLLILLAIESH